MKYSNGFKQGILRKVLPPESRALSEISKETGIAEQTIRNWMERLTLGEQVRLVSDAQVEAGNHGAGLTHILWMNPGSRILELRRRGYRLNNCYYSLAQAMQVDYYYPLCEAVNEAEDTHTVDFIVDVAEFEGNVALLGNP